jgi:TubC N-terminal docking domain
VRQRDIGQGAVAELLTELNRSGLELHVVAGQLRVRGPRTAMTEELSERIREHKAEIVDTIAPAVVDPSTSYPSLGLTYADIRGGWDSKSTVTGEPPVLEQVLEMAAYLGSPEGKRNGLRCGLKAGYQCFHCLGIPCVGSTPWRPGGTNEAAA